MISDERFDALVERAWKLSATGGSDIQGMAFNAILHLLVSNEHFKIERGKYEARRRKALKPRSKS